MNALRLLGLVRLTKRSLASVLLAGLLAGPFLPVLLLNLLSWRCGDLLVSHVWSSTSANDGSPSFGVSSSLDPGRWRLDIPRRLPRRREFAILNNKVNPIYVTHKLGQRRELRGPSSPIGDRYMGFHLNGRGDFGIHGTAWPHWVQIRAAVSLSYVRMFNSYIRQLFDAVDMETRLEIRS